jgi:hypothetical protein
VRLSSLGTSATNDDECGAVGGMKIGRGDRSTRRNPAPVSLYPPQITHDLTWARTRVAAMGNRRLTAWAMAEPPINLVWSSIERVLFADLPLFQRQKQLSWALCSPFPVNLLLPHFQATFYPTQFALKHFESVLFLHECVTKLYTHKK